MFLNNEERQTILNGYINLKTRKSIIPNYHGFTFPAVFSLVKTETKDDPLLIEEYFKKCEKFRDNFFVDYKVNLPEKLRLERVEELVAFQLALMIIICILLVRSAN